MPGYFVKKNIKPHILHLSIIEFLIMHLYFECFRRKIKSHDFI